MKVLVTGATGLLGKELVKKLSSEFEVIGTSSKDFDITDLHAVRNFMSLQNPDFVVHCAAFTRVDECEKDRVKAFAVNTVGARNVALACAEGGVSLVFVSTDYVFSGKKGTLYIEADHPDPVNIYGKSKYLAEKLVISVNSKTAVLRVAWLYGEGRETFVDNIVKKVLRSENVYAPVDMVSCPTYTVNLAVQIAVFLKNFRPGIYHAVDHGVISRYELARLICRLLGASEDLIKPVKARDIYFAPRPYFSGLYNLMLKAEGLDVMGDLESSLKEYLTNRYL